MKRASLIACALSVAACGGEPASPEPRPAEQAVPYRASSEGRTVVARVDGEPIYADCVEIQARAHGLDREAALDECIDFELLALEAKRRGLLGDPEVVLASRREAVRAFIDAHLEIDGPEDLSERELRDLWQNPRLTNYPLKAYFDHEEVRRSSYCLIKVPKEAEAGGPEDLLAAALSRTVYAAAVSRGGVEPKELMELCKRLAPVSSERRQAFKAYMVDRSQLERGGTDPRFARPLFALEKPGDLTAPVRGDAGWFVIRLDRVRPEQHLSFEEALPLLRELLWSGSPWFEYQPWPRLLEAYRQSLFLRWYDRLAKKVEIETYPERIPEPRAALR